MLAGVQAARSCVSSGSVKKTKQECDRFLNSILFDAHDRQLDLLNLGELPLLVAQRAVASRAKPLGDAIEVKDVAAVTPRDTQALL